MLSLIVAYDDERGIGKDNDLLWRISDDLKRFKALTTGHPIIMGRKTYQSIGRPLPERVNIVVTRQADFMADGCEIVDSLNAALQAAFHAPGSDEVFIIGGGEIYAQALPQVDRIYATEVRGTHEATVFFPKLPVGFTETAREPQESDGHHYAFVTFERG